ncbi:MAG: Hpt domain-containing protein [Bacteroidetes bacterium]|nr:Hpt domain-containing protein [Bacteroidota bacterium]
MIENNKTQQTINLGYLIGLSRGDKGFVKNMINVFLEENPKEIEMLEASIREVDFDMIRASAHKLKSTIPFVGLDLKIGEVVNEIETLAAKGKDIESIKQLFSTVKKNSDMATEELVAYLSEN